MTKRSKAHAEHPHYCSCGAIVWGNGGKAGHSKLQGPEHRWLSYSQFIGREHPRIGPTRCNGHNQT